MYIPKNGLYITGTAELGYVFREKSLKNEYLYKFRANEVYDYYKQYRAKLKALGIKEYDAEIEEPVGHKAANVQPVAQDRAAGAKPNVNQHNPVQPAGTNQDLVNAGNTLKSAYDAYNNETDATKKKDKEKKYKEALEKYNEIYTKSKSNALPSLDEKNIKPEDRLKPRPFYILNLDARAYHKVFKDKNSMAYRVTLGYASKGTPENMLFHTSDGTILRGYPDKLASILATATVENRTYINDYVQLVAFAEVGIHNNSLSDKQGAVFYKENEGRYAGLRKYEGFKEMFTKEHVKADIGIGARLTTPLGVIRLDYAWPLINKPDDKGAKKGFDLGGKFSFGFGQTF